MSGFIRPWDVNQSAEQEEQNVKPQRSLYDNFSDLFSAASANFDEVRGSEQLGDLRNELMNSQNLSDDEYNAKRAEYIQKEYERQQARNRFMEAQKNLEDNDSFLKNLTQVGGTVEGMAAQLVGTAGGAALGALASPFTAGGSIAMGAKIGNAAGAVAGGYLDARSVALQAEEEVLEKGGTWEQAKLAYEEALKKASLTTLPETAVDIIMGNRLMRSALGSKAARNIAGSALGRVGSSVLDPAARLGTKAAFASGKGLVGRGVGLATDIALQGATEAGQEVTQDYIANREVAKALGQQDNEYSLGGFKDYALSDQGLETMKTAGIMGAVFGGAGGVLSSGQYLQRGAETSMGIKAHNATQSMIDDGNLKLDKQKRAEEEKLISLIKGISPAQLATWSDADVIAESSVIRGQYRSLYTGEDSDVAQVREAVDATDRLSKTDNSTTREGDLTERSKTLLDRMGIDNREMFNSPAEKSVIEQAKKANEELQKQANKNEEEQSITTTEKKEGEPAIKANITVNTAEGMAQDENGNITTNDNDATTVTNQAQQIADKSKTDGVIKGFSTSFTGEDIGSFKNNDVQGMNYVNSHEYTNESIGVDILASEIMGNVQLKNMETGKIKPFNSPEEAKQYLVDNQNNKDAFAFQEEKQQSKEEELPDNGVDVDTSGHTGQLIQSVDDLYNLAVERPELVSAYDFMEFIRMKQHMGVEGIDIYLNKEKYGYHKDPKTGKYVKVHGYAARAKGKASAFIQLYKSGDLASAVHEIAHIGYWNLNESDKRTFDYYAIKTQGRYIADMLDENYDNNFVNRLVKLVNDVKNNKLDEEDKQLQDKINSHPATRQIQANLIPFYNSVVYNEPININNLTKEQQIAIQERWAWEMSQWYIEGYIKGVEPNNIVERIEQRGCASIAPELNALLRVWEHIHHKDSGIENVYSGEQAVENKQEETSQNLPAIDPIGNIQFTNELQRQAVPNINMPMNFGGEQAIQYNVPTLGESYNVASRMNLPQADNGVETNQTDVVPTVENQNSNIATPKETNSINEDIGNGTFRFRNDLQANPLPINAMQFNNGNDLGETVAGTSFAQKLTLPAENGTVEKNEGGQVNGQTEDTRRGEDLPRTNEGTPNGNNGGEKSIQGRKDEGNMGGTQEGVRNSEEGVLSDQKEESFGRKILGRIPKALKQEWKGLGCNTKIEDWRVVSGKKEYLQLFSDALQKSIDSNVTHGVYVDPMSVEELQDAIVILHKSKKAGLAIDKNGTLHGVFKDQSLDIPYVIYDITLIAREMGCVRMDCYGDFLVRGCSELGFTPVAKLNYTDEYIQDRIKANPKAYETQLKERPTVYILVRNEDSNEVARNKIANKQYVRPSKEELDGLPLFKDKDVGYDSAISYGDSSAQIKKKLGKKFNERAVVMATEDARNYYNTISEQPKQVLDAVLDRIKGSLSASKNEYGYPFLLELQKAIEGGETNDSQQLNKEELQSRIDEINKEIDEFVNEDNTKITKEDKEHSQNFESFSNSYIREGKIFREISGFPEDSKPKTKASKTTQSNKQNFTPTSQLKELKVENGRVVQQETEEEDENAVNNEMAQATPDRVTEKKSKNKDSSKKKFTTNDALKRIRERAKKNNPSTTLKEGVTKKEYDIFKKTGKLPEKQEQSIQITDPVLRDWVDRFTNNGVFDFNEASTELYKELDKGNITQKEYDKLMNDFMEYVENKEELSSQGQEERVYQESADRIIRFMGVSLDRKAGSVSSRDMEQEFRKELKRLRIPDYVYFRFIHPDKLILNTKKDKNAKRFIKALMKINEKMFENGNVYRGLDGRWRYWIDDRNATFNENVFDLIDNFITMDKEDLEREELTIEDLGLGDEVYKLSEVLNHDEFFKLCPEASDVTVQFTTPEWDRDLEGYGGYYLDGKIVINLNTLRAASNIAEEGLRRKLLKRWLMGVLLHETQHFVQHEDQFARGFNESGFMQVLNDKSRVPDVVDLLIEYKDKILKDEDDKTRYGGIFNNKERLEQLLSSDDYEDYWRQVEIAGMVRKSKLPMDFYYRSLGEEEARFTGENWSEGTTEEKYYIGGESFDLEEVSTAGYLTESGEFEFVDLDENISDIPKLKERLAKAIKFSQNNVKELQADLKRLQNSTEETDGGVVSRDEALNMTKDEIKSAREEIKVCKKILQKLKEGKEITKREEEIKPKVPMNSEEYFKDLTSEEGDYVHIDKRFQEAKKQKPLTDEEIEAMDRREEKEYEKRKERIQKADEAGELSDVVKDVYSVTFTKSAQNFAENRTRMEYFDNRDKYWNRSEKDGKVIYTRKTPLEHHKKVITYNGANELMQEDKKKSKPEQWLEWVKDRIIKYAFNDMHFLAKAARKLGKYDAYVKMIVTKGYALKANTAMQRGIKYNGKYTRALNDIIKEIGEEKQKDFIEYCIAKRVIDLSKRDVPVYQDMKPDEAAELIKKYESGADAKLFMKNQKDFVEYNKALLHVLVDSGIHTEEEFQKLIEVDPNFIPLTKVMDDADMGFNSIQAARSIVNVKTPLKRIGTSFRKVKNPFLEMQKRTAEYYAIASRNKAGQIFVNEIANALDKKANGDTIAKGQGMIRQVSVDEKDGNLITKPDDKQQIIYVCNNGKHEFYQVSDPEIYRALKALDADQMGTIQKMIDPFLHAPSALIRETATMVPDFGVRNLLRDGGEAFLTSEHGFLPFIDQIWGMYQMANNTEWYQRFLEQKGEYGTYNRENANDGVARIEDTIDEKVNPIKNFNEIRNAALQKLTNKKNSKATRAVALLQLMGSMPYAVIKSNKRLNDYLEMGTRIGEFKNAKMGYNGTLDRLSRGGILDWNPNLNKAKQDDILAAGAAKEITLNFEQYGIIGKQLNRYIPFFNATLQGIYKMCNALELMATGTTLSGQKNRTLQSELIFKAALITAIGIGVAAAGEGDDDYEEANQYEKENFWILPNGLRFPKDQVLGKLFGNVAEKSYTQWRKGKFEPSDILRSIKENFTPDKFIPALAEIALGGMYNYDTFYKSAIVPEYMQGKLGHLQKDLATSNMASDVSDFLWKYTRTDVSAKRLDWALQKNLTNCKKYIDAIYDLSKKAYDPKSFNEKMARGYDKGDSTGAFVGGLKDDIPKPLSLITGTFATNRTNYKSISDFYERYNDLKKLATDEGSMSKEDKRAWKRYEQAYKKDKVFRKELRAIKSDKSLTGKQKREKADKIFKQQIKLAKWAEG